MGKVRHEWPIRLFVTEAHAIAWVADYPEDRNIWRVHVKVIEDLEYVPPSRPGLRPKGGGA